MHSDEPSHLQDVVPDGCTGLHHISFFENSPDQLSRAYAEAGYPIALRFVLGDYEAIFIDTTPIIGCQIQLYPATPKLRAVYDFVKAQSTDFDGKYSVRDMPKGELGF